MNARLLAHLNDLRASYWFIPSLLAVAAVALSFLTTMLDDRYGAEWIEQVSWLTSFRPDGARAFLSTIAGSMIGVAGVTFSITIASVVYASGQYGPRLLTNFMSDRGNQFTLGTFIGTFLYCLLVLRTVRGADEHDTANAVGAFVPHVSILIALVLALASVGVLIYFIHHTPESIHVSNVIAGVGGELHHRLDELFPARFGRAAPGDAAEDSDDILTEMPDDFFDRAQPIRADGSGYLQGVDADALLTLASEHDLLIRVRHRPGDFLCAGDSLVLAWPEEHVTDAACEDLRVAFAWGTQRTALQDVRFLVNELVEIAARALSPGVNDPFTAISCLDWLSASLKVLADREFPSADRYDETGRLRVVAQPTTFAEFVGSVYGQLRPYLAADRNASLHALKTLGEIAGRTTDDQRRACLRHEADALMEGASAALALDADRASVEERYRIVQQILAQPEAYEAIASRVDWVGGTA